MYLSCFLPPLFLLLLTSAYREKDIEPLLEICVYLLLLLLLPLFFLLSSAYGEKDIEPSGEMATPQVYDFLSEENESKWKNLLAQALTKVHFYGT